VRPLSLAKIYSNLTSLQPRPIQRIQSFTSIFDILKSDESEALTGACQTIQDDRAGLDRAVGAEDALQFGFKAFGMEPKDPDDAARLRGGGSATGGIRVG